MDHRKTPAGNSLILPLWAILTSAALCVAGAGYLIAVSIGDSSTDSPRSAASTVSSSEPPAPVPPSQFSASEPTPSPDPTATSAPNTAEPTPHPTTPEPTAPESAVERDTPVGVYNNTRTRGLAARTASDVEVAGWEVVRVANWRGAIPATTVYYPEGFQQQAQLLAGDMDIARVRPAVSSMSSDQLTLILAGS